MDTMRVWFALGISMLMGAFAQAQWIGGADVVVDPAVSTTISTAQPTIKTLKVNGNLTFATGGSVTVTNWIWVGDGTNGSMTIQNGATVTKSGTNAVYIGYQGGNGVLTVEAGGTLDIPNHTLFISGNRDTDSRVTTTRGSMTVSGTVIASMLELTPFYPQYTSQVAYVEAGQVFLESGGEVAVGAINKNDRAISRLYFNGGKLRFRSSSGSVATVNNGGILYLHFATNHYAVFDTASNSVTWTDAGYASYCAIDGAGGLRKVGAGRLNFSLTDTNNLFTGPIRVEEGLLDIGRPLYEGQTVTVYSNATFVCCSTNDFSKITVLGGGKTVLAVDFTLINGLDMTALNSSLYYRDRLAGPPRSRTASISGTITTDVGIGTPSLPFHLMSNEGTLNLTQTGLESLALMLDTGTGTIQMNNDYRVRPTNPLTFGVGSASLYFNLPSKSIYFSGPMGNAITSTIPAGVVVQPYNVFAGDAGDAVLNIAGRVSINNGLFIASGYTNDTTAAYYPSADVTITNATVTAGMTQFTVNWPTTNAALRNIASGTLNLHTNGVLETGQIQKFNAAQSTMLFDGGLVRARWNHGYFLEATSSNASLRFVAPAGRYITFDSQGYAITFQSPYNNARTIATGAGGFKKSGSGVLSYLLSESSYTGDTVVEGGTLMLGANNQLPDGIGFGNLVLGSTNASLNLNGFSEQVNGLSGSGVVSNGSSRSGTLGVLADGSSATWTRSLVGSGPVVINKVGAGTLTLSGRDVLSNNLVVSEGRVVVERATGYTHYRFKVDNVRSASANSMQLSEIQLLDSATNSITLARSALYYDLTGGYGTTPSSSAFPAGEAPEKAVDGIKPASGSSTNNKWLDFRANLSRSAVDRDRVWVTLKYPAMQPIVGYNWGTANDGSDRDPTAWRLQGSWDNVTFYNLDVRTNQTITSMRNEWITNTFIAVDSRNTAEGKLFGGNPLITVQSNGTFVVNQTLVAVGGVMGIGNVEVNQSALTVTTTNRSVFAGQLSGTGTLTIQGNGVQSLSKAQNFSGDLIVKSGVAELMGEVPYTWFRFTIKENYQSINVTQLSEFALYSADGLRRNMNLADRGIDVAGLQPGQFACPASYAVGGGAGSEYVDKLFDNNSATKWCLINNVPVLTNSASWRTVVMRLSSDTPEIVGYNLCSANDVEARDPTTWVLECSGDGVNWQVADARNQYVQSMLARYTWFNNGQPFNCSASCAPTNGVTAASVLGSNVVVNVQSGATLRVVGNIPIHQLRVDSLNAGTITKLVPAQNGVLYVDNAVVSGKTITVPLRILSLVNAAQLKTWKISVNGQQLLGVDLIYDPTTQTLSTASTGTVLLVH